MKGLSVILMLSSERVGAAPAAMITAFQYFTLSQTVLSCSPHAFLRNGTYRFSK